MIEPGRQLNLTLEAVPGRGSAHPARQRDLDRHLAPGALLFGSVHHALPAVRDQRHRGVPRDQRRLMIPWDRHLPIAHAAPESLEKHIRLAHLRQPIAADLARREMCRRLTRRLEPRIADHPIQSLQIKATVLSLMLVRIAAHDQRSS